MRSRATACGFPIDGGFCVRPPAHPGDCRPPFDILVAKARPGNNPPPVAGEIEVPAVGVFPGACCHRSRPDDAIEFECPTHGRVRVCWCGGWNCELHPWSPATRGAWEGLAPQPGPYSDTTPPARPRRDTAPYTAPPATDPGKLSDMRRSQLLRTVARILESGTGYFIAADRMLAAELRVFAGQLERTAERATSGKPWAHQECAAALLYSIGEVRP